MHGNTPGSRFGNKIGAGDFNADGYTDLVIGGWGFPSENGEHSGRAWLYLGPFSDTINITFDWDTTDITPGKHILKASIAPVSGEEDVADNTMTVTLEVKERRQ